MGKLEQDFLNSCIYKPSIWLRFLDDIFMIWDYSLDMLDEFINNLNSVHPNIKFTYTASKTKVSFLDVDVMLNDQGDLDTNVHVKETNIHNYVEYSSSHPKSCKDGIPFSQAKRYRRIISDNNSYIESLDDLKQHFVARNYPEYIVDQAFTKASELSQQETLLQIKVDSTKEVIPFVVEYNRSLPQIGYTINKYWDLLSLSDSDSVKHVHTFKPVVAYKRPRNLKDSLVKTNFASKEHNSFSSNKCSRKRCSHCPNIIETNTFRSSQNAKIFNVKSNMNCSSKDVIYLIECKKCKMQYVGQTKQKLSERMNRHRYDILNTQPIEFGTSVAQHFNENGHSIADFSFMPIDRVSGDMNRLIKETVWIHSLDTLTPSGLNRESLFTI